MIVDNFALTMFQTCPAKYYLRMRQGWTPRRKSPALNFGGVIHSSLARWYSTESKAEALLAIEENWPVDASPDWRDKAKAVEVMTAYLRTYPTENFVPVGWPEDPLIERSFTFFTGKFLQCLCGGEANEHGQCALCEAACEPIEYGGIFDGLVTFSGAAYVLEHKTTTQMGPSYFYQFRPNNQVTGYIWGASQMSHRKVGGAIINALGIYKAQAPKFERSITNRTDAEIAEWLNYVKATCDAIKTCDRTGVWPFHTGACTLYGLCEFHSVHVLPQERERQKLLEQDYMLEEWRHEERE